MNILGLFWPSCSVVNYLNVKTFLKIILSGVQFLEKYKNDKLAGFFSGLPLDQSNTQYSLAVMGPLPLNRLEIKVRTNGQFIADEIGSYHSV